MQKGFAIIYLLTGIVILVSVGGGAYYFGKSQIANRQTQSSVAAQVQQSAQTQSPAQEVDETVYTEGTRSANWKTYTGKNFSITYPNQLITAPSELVEVIESIQFDKRGQEKKNYIRVSVYSGGEVRFNNRKETYLFYGLHNAQQENFLIDGVNAWRYSGTDAEGENITQYVLFYKDNLGFEIDNFNIDRDIFDQIISTFKFN